MGCGRVYERRGVLHEDRRKGGRSAMLRFTVPGTPGTYAFIAVVAVESTQPSYSFTLGAFCDEPVRAVLRYMSLRGTVCVSVCASVLRSLVLCRCI
jgi:hypothetical protein